MKSSRMLRYARRSAAMTQRQLAKATGISQPAIARIESGHAVPRVDTLEKLLAACGFTVATGRRAGAEVDKSLLRELLKLTPAQRAEHLVAAVNNMAGLLG